MHGEHVLINIYIHSSCVAVCRIKIGDWASLQSRLSLHVTSDDIDLTISDLVVCYYIQE